jgi:hypothetical protein
LFTGTPILSNHDLLLAFVFPQVDVCEDVCCDDIFDAEVGGGCLGILGIEVKGDWVAVGGKAIEGNEPHQVTSGYGVAVLGAYLVGYLWR